MDGWMCKGEKRYERGNFNTKNKTREQIGEN